MCGRGMHGRARGHAWQGGMHGGGGGSVAEGMCGRGGACMAGRHVW